MQANLLQDIIYEIRQRTNIFETYFVKLGFYTYKTNEMEIK